MCYVLDISQIKERVDNRVLYFLYLWYILYSMLEFLRRRLLFNCSVCFVKFWSVMRIILNFFIVFFRIFVGHWKVIGELFLCSSIHSSYDFRFSYWGLQAWWNIVIDRWFYGIGIALYFYGGVVLPLIPVTNLSHIMCFSILIYPFIYFCIS